MKNTGIDTVKRIFVKVYGFSDLERHALNTGFRLSTQRAVSYALWSPESQQDAAVVLLDGESWEASLALANPDNDDIKLIWVGSHPPAQAWKTFAEPMQWSAVLTALDELYLPHLLAQSTNAGVVDIGVDFLADDTQPIHVGFDGSTHDYDAVTAPMLLELTSPDDEDQLLPASNVKRVLLVEANSDERLYWRAKLAEVGFFFVDEAATAETAQSFVAFNVYSLVIVDLDAGSPNVWQLVKHIVASRPAIDHLLITRKGLTSTEVVRAWFAGAHKTFAKPMQPAEVKKLLSKLQQRL